MPANELSHRQAEILRVINDKLTRDGFPPSVREIALRVGLASPSTIKHHLDSLEAGGYLERHAGLPRALDLRVRGCHPHQYRRHVRDGSGSPPVPNDPRDAP